LTPRSRAEANRLNAIKSTGPRSLRGKARAAQNARRHGFASASTGRDGHPEEVEYLARIFAGNGTSTVRLAQARVVAEMELLLGRICEARVNVINRHLSGPSSVVAVDELPPKAELAFQPPAAEPKSRSSNDWDNDSWKQVLPELLSLDRYEARALARRTRAITLMNEAFESKGAGLPEKL